MISYSCAAFMSKDQLVLYLRQFNKMSRVQRRLVFKLGCSSPPEFPEKLWLVKIFIIIYIVV